MKTIYQSNAVSIFYDPELERANVKTNDKSNPKFFDIIVKNDSIWNQIKIFLLKHCTWSWISVKDREGQELNQIVDIDSIARHIFPRLKPDEIKNMNDEGRLFNEIERAVKYADLPEKNALDALMSRRKEVLERLDFIGDLDESNPTAFIDILKFRCENQTVSAEDYSVLFTSFAIKHFKYVDVAREWVQITFNVSGFVSELKLEPGNVSFIPEQFRRPIGRLTRLDLIRLMGANQSS